MPWQGRFSRTAGDSGAVLSPPDIVSVSEIGDAENISKSYVSRILRLALLSPDLIEAILTGSTDQGIMLEQLERPLPAVANKVHGGTETCNTISVKCSEQLVFALLEFFRSLRMINSHNPNQRR